MRRYSNAFHNLVLHDKSDSKHYDVLKLAIPVTRKQAKYILKKRLHVRKIYYIVVCDDNE